MFNIIEHNIILYIEPLKKSSKRPRIDFHVFPPLRTADNVQYLYYYKNIKKLN